MGKVLDRARLNRTKIETAWFDFVRAMLDSDIAVIFADEDSPRPSPPYVTVKIPTGPSAPFPDDILTLKSDAPLPGKVIHEQQGERRYTASLNSYAPDDKKFLASDIMDLLHTAVKSEEGRLILRREVDIAVIDRGTPVDLTVAIEDGFESRYNMDVIFSAVQSFEVDVSAIEKTSIGGTLNKGGPDEILVPKFDVPDS